MRKIATLALVLTLFTVPAFACVGKSLLVGTDSTDRSKVIAQALAILINERTGTTIEVRDFADAKTLHEEMVEGHVDLALAYVERALKLVGITPPEDPAKALEQAKSHYSEELNLKWLSPLGFAEEGNPGSSAMTLSQKHALKKFPALPRLIAKTKGLFTEEVVDELAGEENRAGSVRSFLRTKKLI